MVETIKFSQMADGGNLKNNDKVPGLGDLGENVLFNNAWVFLPSGTTAERPLPSPIINYRLRFNTDEQLYEYYDAILGAWTQLQESLFTQGPFVTYTASASIPDAQNLGALANGILRQTITAGVATLDIAVNGVNYYGPGFVIPGADGGTGHNNNGLTINLGGAVTGYALISDSSGNVTLQSISASGAITTINGDSGSVTPTAGVITITGSTTGLTFSGAGSTLTLGGILVPAKGGLGTSTIPTAGQIPIGTSGGVYTPAAINSGTNILVGNGSGSITISITGVIAGANGGTGVANTGKTITIGGNLTYSGAFNFTGTLTNTTSVTFPTSGTLATVGGTVVSLQGTANQVLVNGTSGSPVTGTAITLTTPQNIGTTSIPTFAGAFLNGEVDINQNGANTSDGTAVEMFGNIPGQSFGVMAGVVMGHQFDVVINSTFISELEISPVFNIPVATTLDDAYGIKIYPSSQIGAGTVSRGTGIIVYEPLFGTTKYAAQFLGAVNIGTTAQLTISRLGVITGTGAWNAAVITGTYGGTGVNNGASTFTIGGNTAFSGSFTFTGTLTGNTSVTFPTSGTLATTSGTVASLTGTANQVLVNGTSGTPTTGAITLTLPQSIDTAASVNFGTIFAGSLSSPLIYANGLDTSTSAITAQTQLKLRNGDATTNNWTTIKFYDNNNNVSSIIGAQYYTSGGSRISDLVFFAKNSSTATVEGMRLVGSSNTLSLVNALPASSGGTGVNNGSSFITVGGNVTFSGAFTFTGTITGNTSVTFPTSGTLLTSATAVTSITGTTNQIIASASTGAVTLSAPQNLHTSAVFQVANLGIGAACNTAQAMYINTNTYNALEIAGTVTANLFSLVAALNFSLTYQPNANITSAYGIWMKPVFSTSTNTITTAYGYYSAPTKSGGNALTNLYGGYFEQVSGATTDNYSLYAYNVKAGSSGQFLINSSGDVTSHALTVTTFTLGSVVFSGSSGAYSQDNSNFFWDNTNKRLGIGTGGPDATLHVNQTSASAVNPKLLITQQGGGGVTPTAGVAIYETNGVGDVYFDSLYDLAGSNVYFRGRTNGTPIVYAQFTGAGAIILGVNSSSQFTLNTVTTTAANAGGTTAPALVQGFIDVIINGTHRKIPYYLN